MIFRVVFIEEGLQITQLRVSSFLPVTTSTSTNTVPAAATREISRRRTFAIISAAIKVSTIVAPE